MRAEAKKPQIPMKLDEFREQFVEGYLFCDLRSMASIKLPAGQRYGAVGYPMVTSALAGIELLGAVTSTDPFDPFAGDRYFCCFWKELHGDKRGDLGKVIYQLLRHGVVHVFVSKPRITVQKAEGNPFHLQRDANGGLIVDATVLASDLERANRKGVRARLQSLETVMQLRLEEMLTRYSTQLMQQAGVIDAAVPVDHSSLSLRPIINRQHRPLEERSLFATRQHRRPSRNRAIQFSSI